MVSRCLYIFYVSLTQQELLILLGWKSTGAPAVWVLTCGVLNERLVGACLDAQVKIHCVRPNLHGFLLRVFFHGDTVVIGWSGWKVA